MRKEVLLSRRRAYEMRMVEESRETFLKEQLTTVFEDKLVLAISNFDNLEPKQQWDVLLRMLPYITPKLNAVNVETRHSKAIDILMERLGNGAKDAEEILEPGNN